MDLIVDAIALIALGGSLVFITAIIIGSMETRERGYRTNQGRRLKPKEREGTAMKDNPWRHS